MDNWKASLRGDPTVWLLEDVDPSVRYFTLKDLLDKPEDDAQVQDAGERIMQSAAVRGILEKQGEPAYLESYPRFYTDKYTGLVWSLIVLAELGASPVPHIQAQCEYLLRHSQETGDGGFSMHEAAKKGGGRISEVIPCLTGNMVWCLIRMGFLEDPRLQQGINWLTRFMRFNDGAEDDPQVPPYDRLEPCWGRHTCSMAVVKALKGLSAIPPERRTQAVNGTISRAAEFMLMHRVHKRSHDLSRVSRPGWLKFSFPLMYQTDLLEILDLLTGLGIRDSRMEEAVRFMLSKQDGTGRWFMEETRIGGKMLLPPEGKGEPSKWLTLRAMRVLKRYCA